MLINVVTDMVSIRIRFSFVAVLALMLGAVSQVSAESDISGSWKPLLHEDGPERGVGWHLVDFAGLALNDEGKALALSTSYSRYSMIERQCVGWLPSYLSYGLYGLRIWADTDPLQGHTTAWHIGPWEDRAETIIYLDGREHPPADAPHTRGAFWTGKWRGNTLTTYATHMKAGAVRRNGAQTSDQATITSHFIRHGSWMTVVMFIDDPAYLSESQPVSKDFQLKTGGELTAVGAPCLPVYEGTDPNVVPHYLPGKNTEVDDLVKQYGIPREALLGGAETMYPDYRKKLKAIYVRPEKCIADCGGAPPNFGPPEGGGPPGAPPSGGPPAPKGAPAPAGAAR